MSNGQDLRINIDRIVTCIGELKSQRDELSLLIENQLKEKSCLEAEVERITYKLGLLSKNLCQRIATKEEYDKTIKEAEEMYKHLTVTSSTFLQNVTINSTQLQQAMDKRIGSDSVVNVFEDVTKTNDEMIQRPQKKNSETQYETATRTNVGTTDKTSTLEDDFDFSEALRKEAREYDVDT